MTYPTYFILYKPISMSNMFQCALGWLPKKIKGKKPPLFLPQLPKQAQLPKCEASTECLAYASSSTSGLKTPFFVQKCCFQA